MAMRAERYRELRNAVGLSFIGYIAAVYIFWNLADPADIERFGWFILVSGIMMVFLFYKMLQTRGAFK